MLLQWLVHLHILQARQLRAWCVCLSEVLGTIMDLTEVGWDACCWLLLGSLSLWGAAGTGMLLYLTAYLTGFWPALRSTQTNCRFASITAAIDDLDKKVGKAADDFFS